MHADDHSDSDNDDVPLSASAPRKLAVDPDMLEEVMQLASAGERWADEATCSAQDCQGLAGTLVICDGCEEGCVRTLPFPLS